MLHVCNFIHSPRITTINYIVSRQLLNFTVVFYVDFLALILRSKLDNFTFKANVCNLILLVSSQWYVT